MSYILLEYECRACGERIESLESRAAPSRIVPHAPCNAVAVRVISAPKIATQWATVTRGKSDPPPPGALDTRALADGMKRSEWRAQRSKWHQDRRRAQVRNMVS